MDVNVGNMDVNVGNMDFGSRAQVGKKGEDVALRYLEGLGMQLVARNWRCGHKELDLVMDDGEFLRIVEVRSLVFPNIYPPQESVDWNKRRKVIGAARRFAQLHFVKNEIVFDIVSVVFKGEEAIVEYIPNAFAPQW